MPGFCPCYGPGCVEDVLSDRRNIEAANSAANVRAVEEATLGFVPFAETIGKTALAISTGEEEHAYSAMGSLAFDVTSLAKGIAKAGKGLTKKSAELRNSTRIADDVLSPNALKNAALGNGKASNPPLATTLGRGSAATKALAKETKSAQASAKNLDYEEAVYPYQIQDNLKLLQKFHSSNKIDPLPGSDTYGALNRVSTTSWSKKSTDDSVAKQSDKTTPPTTGPPPARPSDSTVSASSQGAAQTVADNYFQQNRRYWSSDPIEFNGNRVYQRNDLIDPNRIDPATGLTNKQLMQNGYAPYGPDGNKINLHHLTQTENGAIALTIYQFCKNRLLTLRIRV